MDAVYRKPAQVRLAESCRRVWEDNRLRRARVVSLQCAQPISLCELLVRSSGIPGATAVDHRRSENEAARTCRAVQVQSLFALPEPGLSASPHLLRQDLQATRLDRHTRRDDRP